MPMVCAHRSDMPVRARHLARRTQPLMKYLSQDFSQRHSMKTLSPRV
jgi:hypothetical protein